MNEELLRLYDALNSQLDLRTNFTTPHAPETNHVEFKEKSIRNTPDLSDHDKKNFSKALSSFSNAEGGLLIWGISIRRRGTRDHAFGLKQITDVREFAERLRTAMLDSITPGNHKVKIKELSNRRGNGFVVCLIPSSDNVPVRAMIADREYWVRMDGRSMRLEHLQIRDMMLRHAHPELDFDIFRDDTQDGYPRLNFHLTNRGKALAKWWGWFAEVEGQGIHTVRDCHDVSSLNPGRVCLSKDGGMNAVIHPNGITVTVGSAVLDRPQSQIQVTVRVKWYCEDMAAKEKAFTLTLLAMSEQ